MRSRALDRARLHIPGHSQALRVSAVAHFVQLADGDVIALAILHAGIREVAQQEKNQDRSPAELQISFALTGHEEPPGGSDYRSLRLYATSRSESRFRKFRDFEKM